MKINSYTEKDLNTSLSELAHETLRELFIAAKKVSIYSSSHPLSRKAIGGPFILMEKVFGFKKYFNLHISSGHLYVMNIRVKQSTFAEQTMGYMQILDIIDILFEAGMTADQLALFLDRFVKRLPATDYQNLMTTHLANNKIDTIHINSEKGFKLFESGRQFRADLAGDFSARSIVSQSFGDDLESLSNLLADDYLPFDEFISRYNIDYYHELVAYLIPEKISSMKAEDIIGLLSKQVIEIVDNVGNPDFLEKSGLNKFKNLITALNYHSKREEILGKISDVFADHNVSKEIITLLLPETSVIKIESSEEIDQFLYATFNEALPGHKPDDFRDLFSRLLRTGQKGKAKSVVNILINHLAGSDLDLREKALILIRSIMTTYKKATADFLGLHFIAKLDEYISDGKETFEFSDMIWELAQTTLTDRDYKFLSAICDILQKKRTYENGVWSFESLAAKKSIEELNRRKVIAPLIEDLVRGPRDNIQYIKNILITIGSEDVALALSNIISHESRQVRQYVLKILSEMGKSALNVFSEVMKYDSYFERDEGKRELPDEKWYVVRNSIFVLGSLKDPEACRALELRINDNDTRVRRNIVGALEKIGGDNAADILMIMAEDPDREIRQAAIIAVGFVGPSDNAPELINLAYKRPTEIIDIITMLGKLGGHEAKDFLSELLTDKKLISQFTSGYSSKDELKLATIKALGRIGDIDSINKIKEFDQSLSGTQKIFFGGSKINKAIQDILKK